MATDQMKTCPDCGGPAIFCPYVCKMSRHQRQKGATFYPEAHCPICGAEAAHIGQEDYPTTVFHDYECLTCGKKFEKEQKR